MNKNTFEGLQKLMYKLHIDNYIGFGLIVTYVGDCINNIAMFNGYKENSNQTNFSITRKEEFFIKDHFSISLNFSFFFQKKFH